MHWSLAHMILDLVQNSIEAGARTVDFTLDEVGSALDFEIRDDGRGMDSATLAAAVDPFYTEPGKHPGRRVGLGLPFLLQTVSQTGGRHELKSERGVGTKVAFRLDLAHLDTPPLGNVAELLVDLMCFEGDYELNVIRRHDTSDPEDPERTYRISRSDLQDALGDLTSVGGRRAAEDFLKNWEESIHSEGVQTVWND
jgi:hypothetical protein